MWTNSISYSYISKYTKFEEDSDPLQVEKVLIRNINNCIGLEEVLGFVVHHLYLSFHEICFKVKVHEADTRKKIAWVFDNFDRLLN